MWVLLLQEAVTRKGIVNLPAPYKGDKAARDEFVAIFKQDITDEFDVSSVNEMYVFFIKYLRFRFGQPTFLVTWRQPSKRLWTPLRRKILRRARRGPLLPSPSQARRPSPSQSRPRSWGRRRTSSWTSPTRKKMTTSSRLTPANSTLTSKSSFNKEYA